MKNRPVCDFTYAGFPGFGSGVRVKSRLRAYSCRDIKAWKCSCFHVIAGEAEKYGDKRLEGSSHVRIGLAPCEALHSRAQRDSQLQPTPQARQLADQAGDLLPDRGQTHTA